MVRGIYYGSSAMQYLDEKMDIVANNLANVETNGFKRSNVAFNMHMVAEQAKQRDQIKNELPQGKIFSYLEDTPGVIKQTSNPFNFALEGKGFFTIQTPEGIAFTRDGAFSMNEEGYLTTMDGNYVLGGYGPIRLEGKKFSLSDQGDILADNLILDKFLLADFHMDDLVSKGKNLLVPKMPGLEINEAQPLVKQGYLELSNVSIVNEMINMIAINRQYQANDKAIKTNDDALQKAVSQIAK